MHLAQSVMAVAKKREQKQKRNKNKNVEGRHSIDEGWHDRKIFLFQNSVTEKTATTSATAKGVSTLTQNAIHT